MKHTIRQNGQITQIDCEFGSGIFDENGVEIIEGDIVYVTNGYSPDCSEFRWERHKAFFRRGGIILIHERDWDWWETAGGIPSNHINTHTFKVARHEVD